MRIRFTINYCCYSGNQVAWNTSSLPWLQFYHSTLYSWLACFVWVFPKIYAWKESAIIEWGTMCLNMALGNGIFSEYPLPYLNKRTKTSQVYLIRMIKFSQPWNFQEVVCVVIQRIFLLVMLKQGRVSLERKNFH
jgi:hypothetical protein